MKRYIWVAKSAYFLLPLLNHLKLVQSILGWFWSLCFIFTLVNKAPVNFSDKIERMAQLFGIQIAVILLLAIMSIQVQSYVPREKIARCYPNYYFCEHGYRSYISCKERYITLFITTFTVTTTFS